MAKKSVEERNRRREKLNKQFFERRKTLVAKMNDVTLSQEERDAARAKLKRKIPRDAASTRYRNRCQKTGRGRGVLRRFGLSRIELRKCACEGIVPGLQKASW